MPSSDQVPELMYTDSSGAAIGAATTAAAVSWQGGSTTRRLAPPSSAATPGCSPPISVPGMAGSVNRDRGTPRRSRTGADQVAVRGLRNWVVLALVDSLTATPLSQ